MLAFLRYRTSWNDRKSDRGIGIIVKNTGIEEKRNLVTLAGSTRVDAPKSGHDGTSLQENILRTLLYFDIFEYPLRLPEIRQFLPTYSVANKDLRSACLSSPLKDQIAEIDDHFFLKSRSASIVEARRDNERRARHLWKMARLMARILSCFPYVRGIFVSGELSKGVASEHSDIDFFIVTSANRVWIVRTLCMLFKKTFLLNRKKFFCYNHIVSECRLEINERNIYTAIELATLKPLFDSDLHEKLLKANSWVFDYLPNYVRPVTTGVHETSTPSFIERMWNILVPSGKLDAIDRWLLHKWRRVWMKRYPSLTPAKRLELFRSTSDVSTSYVKDFYARIMREYEQRLKEYGLDTEFRTG